jgi:thiol-disulfide isomerase/thioredoxin
MKAGSARVLIVAAVAGALGVLASLWFSGSPLLRTDTGQRALHAAVDAIAPPPPTGVKPAQTGDTMPTITLPDLHGRPQSLPAAYAGRALLINVWASWCGPCVQEMPELDRYAKTQGTDGVQVIGLALDTPEGIRDFLSQVPVAYPILIDSPAPDDASVWLGNRRGVLPYSVLVGADGRIVKRKIGPFEPGEISRWAKLP